MERRDGETWVRVTGAVTHTLGGVRADTQGHVLRADGTPVQGLYAAGVDVGGVASGGYASGLAQALVQGLAAAETIASELWSCSCDKRRGRSRIHSGERPSAGSSVRRAEGGVS